MKSGFATVSTKGQIVIPSELREQLKLEPGTRVSIRREGRMLVLRPINPNFIDEICGSTEGLGDLREKMHRDDEER
jgi:AbrB family looped-hinge helix DNA binding protein